MGLHIYALACRVAMVSMKDRVLSVPIFTTALWIASAAAVPAQEAAPAAASPVASPVVSAPAQTPAPVGAEAAVTAPAAIAPAAAPATAPAADQAANPADTSPVEANPAEANEVVVTARARNVPGDPLQQANVVSFKAIQSVDKAVVGPVALAYKDNLPSPLRTGLRNFLRNLQEPVVFVNYLLQIKPGKAAETLGRFTLNSTLGVAGLVDVAKKPAFNLPYRPNGFAYTMGYYGVKSGPFLFLPLIGPTTLRDVIGRMMDLSLLPMAVGAPFNNPYYAIPTTTIKLLDDRAEADENIEKLRMESPDPYTDTRKLYLQQRQAEIDALHGRKPAGSPAVPAVAPVPVPAPQP